MTDIWFWQLIISPHMAHLAVSLARLGCKVTYVAERAMTADRAEQGWTAPKLPGVKLEWANSDAVVRQLIQAAPSESIHVCQGIRANGLVVVAQRALAARGLQQWIVMETVEDSGWKGVLKRLEYGRLFKSQRNTLSGVLATGYRTSDWVVARGMPVSHVYPFAYFLPSNKSLALYTSRTPRVFRFIFAGRLVPLKRVDWIINTLAELSDQSFELWIVGTGPEEASLRTLSARKLGDRLRWFGQLSLSEVPSVMVQADCLVLPSTHDGWGAVASEAMMAGTPVISSDACGVSGVVRASGVGGVFPVNNPAALLALLDAQLLKGIVDDCARSSLKDWATCLGAKAGAIYLKNILLASDKHNNEKIAAPWA